MIRVSISQSGRGGSIAYAEGPHTASFSWEFAVEPAIALIFGTGGAHWDAVHPWAAGRQREVYDGVGAEVVHQQAQSGHWSADLDTGVLTIYRGA